MDELEDIVHWLGRIFLVEDQTSTLEFAKIIREDFLQQSAFTEYGFMCSLAKAVGIMEGQ